MMVDADLERLESVDREPRALHPASPPGASRRPPAPPAPAASGPLAQPCPEGLVAQDSLQRLGGEARVPVRQKHPAAPERLGHGADVPGHDGRAATHRLDGGAQNPSWCERRRGRRHPARA